MKISFLYVKIKSVVSMYSFLPYKQEIFVQDFDILLKANFTKSSQVITMGT
jgi:hypothetical protein